MKKEVSIYELAQVLCELEKNYELELVTKVTLNGGWLTLMGNVKVEGAPKMEGGNHGNNILSLKVCSEGEEGSILKLTGAKGKKFNIEIASSKFKEINKGPIAIDKVITSSKECKLKVEDTLVFKISDSEERVISIIEKI